MAGINRFYNRQPRTYDLYAPPLELAYKALESAQKRYDTNYQAALKASQIALNALPGDQPTANEFQKKYSTAIDEGLAKAGSDYSQITGLIQNLDRQLAKDLAPGSKYYQVKKNYDDYTNWYNENLKNKDIDPENLSGYSSHFLRNYTSVGEPDPLRGYTQLSLPKLPKMTDWFGDVDKAMTALKPEEFEREVETLGNDGRSYKSKVKTSGVAYERALQAGMSKLLSDPYYVADRRFKAQFMSPAELQQMDMLRVQQAARAAAYSNDSRSNTVETDQAYWNRLSHGLAREKFNWDKSMDLFDRQPVQPEIDPNSSKFTAAFGQHTPSLKEKGIVLSKLFSDKGQTVSKPIEDTWNENQGTTYIPVGGTFMKSESLAPLTGVLKRLGSRNPSSATKQIDRNAILQDPDINSALLNSIIKSKFNGAQPDMNNKEHVRLMDEAQFEYDQSIKSVSTRNVQILPFGNKVADEMGEQAHRLMSAGAIKGAMIWDKDSAKKPNMTGVEDDVRDLMAKVKPSDVKAVGFIPASQSIGPSSMIELAVDGKSILMTLDDQATDARTSQIVSAYDNFYKGNGLGLIPLPEMYGASRLWAKPSADYTRQPNGTWTSEHALDLYTEGLDENGRPTGEYHPIERGGLRSASGQPFDYQYLRNNVEIPILQKYLPLEKGVDKFQPTKPQR